MSEKKPARRGVLASLLGMSKTEDTATEGSPEDEGSTVLEPESTDHVEQPAPAEAEGTSPAANVPPEMRESYEPGWYRISLAQGAVDQPSHEWGPEPEQLSETQPYGADHHAEPGLDPTDPTDPTEENVATEPPMQEPGAGTWRSSWPEPDRKHEEDAPVHAGMRESYEPGWYRISLAQGPAGGVTPAEATEPAMQPAEEAAESPSLESPAPPSSSEGGARIGDFDPPHDAPASEPSPLAETEPVAFAAETPREPPAMGPSLASLAARDRRAALEELSGRGLSDPDVAAVSSLVSDPERDIRALAVQVLAQRAEEVDVDVIERALQDPTDDVRAAALRLAASRTRPELGQILPFAAARRWPLTQQTALEVLPGLISRGGIDEHSLASLLSAIAGMESSPVGPERRGFAELARTIGRERLVDALELPDDRRLGVVRLLLEEGSTEALQAVSAREQDPFDEVRIAATTARDMLGPVEEEEIAPPPEPELPTELPAEEPFAAEEPIVPEPLTASEPSAGPEPEPDLIVATGGVEDEIISGLARALEDPDEGVRERARAALSEVDRSALLAWTREALRSGDHVVASLAGRVAEAATLHEAAGEILERAAGLRPEMRGPLVGGLSSLGLDDGELVALAGSVDHSLRPDAIRLLWQVAGRRVLPALRGMLEDSSGTVRVAVLEVFGESGDPTAIEVAQSVLGRDSSPVVRATAIQVIGRAGLAQRTQSLAQALDDPDPDVRSTAVELLPQGMGRQAGDLLLRAVSDEDDRVWQPAMRHLVSLPERDLSIVWGAIKAAPEDRRDQLTLLLERTSQERLGLVALEHLTSPDHDDRMLAISLASRSGTREALQGIIGTLVDPLPEVRRAGAAALAERRSPDAIPALAQALNDPAPEVRVEALRTLSVIDDDRVLDPLITALKDPEARVRETASEALVRWSSPAVARRLVESLASPVLRRPASEVLARMGQSAVDPLVNLLREGHPDLAPIVGETLERLIGRDVFLEHLGSMDPATRLGAVEALGAMGGPEAVDGLVRALSDPQEGIRIRALKLLGDLRDPRAAEAVRRTVQGDPVPEVVAAAEEALRRFQG